MSIISDTPAAVERQWSGPADASSSAAQTIDTQIAGGGITVDTGRLDYDVEQECIVVDFPGGDVILLPHEARNLADAINDAAGAIDREEGPTIGDLVRCSRILGFKPSEFLGAIEPLLIAQREHNRRTLRRPADVDERLREMDQ